VTAFVRDGAMRMTRRAAEIAPSINNMAEDLFVPFAVMRPVYRAGNNIYYSI
jgi:hypothetical protein